MGNRNASHLDKGQAAEQAALKYLLNVNCELLAKNYNTRQGEIDLIMRHQQDLVFVEVRYRNSKKFGGAIESITAKKQASIKAAAQQFLQQNPDLMFRGCRFDVLLLSGLETDYEYEWITAAF